MEFNVTINEKPLDLSSRKQDLSLDIPFSIPQNNVENNKNEQQSEAFRPSILQCHLFTHFNLITFDEKRFSFPSNVGTYLMFRNEIEDFEVIKNVISY